MPISMKATGLSRVRTAALAVCVTMLTAGLAQAAPAAGQLILKNSGGVLAPGGMSQAPQGLPTVQTGSVFAPLSAQECKDLGGKVETNSLCNSGKSCQTVDQNMKPHEVCLSAK